MSARIVNEKGLGACGAQPYESTVNPAIVAEQDCDRKAFTTLAALLAIRGFSVYELSGGGYLCARWDRNCHLADLAGVRAFYKRIGGAL
jgi:hypothetical protein